MWYENSIASAPKQVVALSLKYEIQKLIEKDLSISSESDIELNDIDMFYKVIISFCDGNYDERMVELSNIDVFELYSTALVDVNDLGSIKTRAEEEYSILKRIQHKEKVVGSDKEKMKSIMTTLLETLDSSWRASINESSFFGWGY